MHDPHVIRLLYKISSDKHVTYKDPEPLSFINELGEFKAESGILQFFPAEHFPSEAMARDELQPFLDAWTISSDISSNIGMIKFDFDHAELVDRAPTLEGGTNHIYGGEARGTIRFEMVMEAGIELSRYPLAPDSFRTNIPVLQAYRRWMNYYKGHESILSMAYFVLTIVERESGVPKKRGINQRELAGSKLSIEQIVLDTLGSMVSERGGVLDARKIHDGSLQELTALEKHWIEQVVKKLIERLGEYRSAEQYDLISMSTLPAL